MNQLSKPTCVSPASCDGASEVKKARTFEPPVDILETPQDLQILVNVPGVQADEVQVDVDQGILTIRAGSGKEEAPGSGFLLQEFGRGVYVRRFRVGNALDTAAIQAKLESGVLRVSLPKKDEARPLKITVDGA